MATTPTPSSDRDLTDPVDAALAGALSRAGDELCEVPADVARGHLDAITPQAVAHAHTAPAPHRGPGASWLAWRQRARRLAGMTAVKVALGAGVAAAGTTGGLAATGNLPAPVQQFVSDGAGWIGLELPAPATDEAEDAVEDREGPDEQFDTDAGPQPDGPVRPVPPPAPDGGDQDNRDDRPVDPDAPADEDQPGPPDTAPQPDDRPAPEQRPEPGDERPGPAEQPDSADAPAKPAPGPGRQDDDGDPAGDHPAGNAAAADEAGGNEGAAEGGAADEAARGDDANAASSSPGGSWEPTSPSGAGGNGPDGSGGPDVGGPVQDQYPVIEDQSPQG